MNICPTLKALMERELELFQKTQKDMTLPQEEFDRLEDLWDTFLRRTRALGGQEIKLLEEP